MPTVTSVMMAPRRRRTRWIAFALGVSLVVIGGGLALAARAVASPRPDAPAPAARVAVDPAPIILRARTMRVQGALGTNVQVSGTLSPALPGLNTLRLSVRRSPGADVRARQVMATVTMPGMDMPPIVATLAPHGHGYAGVIRLPMFGEYRASLVVRALAGRYTGIVALTIPL